jgi:hypothetical protein
LLALLARIRIPFNPSDLNKWSDESTANDFIRDAQHFFLRESRTRWRFFHNSFRYFILRMTSTDLQGDSSSKIDKQFHRRLAALAESDPVGTRWNSERLYHLARAEEWDSVLEVGKQEYFRAQFFAFAPSWIIRDDIGWLARAAQCRSDGLAFLRAVLIDHELAEREFNLDEADLLDLMVRIKGVDYVADSMFDGHNLRMNRRKALNLSGRLAIAGHSLLAKKLFEASEPHELLAGTVKVNSVESEKIASIEAWASVAANFRTVEEILTVIDQVGPEFGDGGETRESKAESDIKVGAISALVQSICETGQDRDIEQLRRTLEERHESAEFLRGIDASLCFQRRDTPLTREALARLENWAAENKLNDSNRILLAEFVYRILGDRPKSERWLQGIDQPDLSGW